MTLRDQVSVGTPPNEAARRVTPGLLSIRNVVVMGGLMHTYGLTMRDRHDLGMLLKSPDRPINTNPIKLMHHQGTPRFVSLSALREKEHFMIVWAGSVMSQG